MSSWHTKDFNQPKVKFHSELAAVDAVFKFIVFPWLREHWRAWSIEVLRYVDMILIVLVLQKDQVHLCFGFGVTGRIVTETLKWCWHIISVLQAIFIQNQIV